MDGLDKDDKVLIIVLVTAVVAALFLMGLGIYSYWYMATHHDYGMKTVSTGDVNWVCLTDRGKAIGCDTVEERQ